MEMGCKLKKCWPIFILNGSPFKMSLDYAGDYFSQIRSKSFSSLGFCGSNLKLCNQTKQCFFTTCPIRIFEFHFSNGKMTSSIWRENFLGSYDTVVPNITNNMKRE